MACQAVTINLISPVYLTIQLLLNPAASDPTAVFVDPADLELMPFSTIISFVLPSIALGLPLLNVLETWQNYAAIAFWQPFPLIQTFVHAALRGAYGVCGGGTGGSGQLDAARQKKAMDRAYKFVLGMTMGVHVIVLGTILSSAVVDAVPATSVWEILSLTSLTNPPTLALLEPPVSALSSRLIVSSFLRWDVYCTCASLAVWAGYQWQSVQETSRVVAMLCKIGVWAVLGGPLAPAIMLLWERDSLVLSRESKSKKANKTQ